MSALLSLGLKGKDGKYKNVTVKIYDNTNEYGKNVSVWAEQTKEQRDAKEERNFLGNGKVVWTDGTINVVEKENKEEEVETGGLDF
jgi:hypothetical protein|tara:strand:- start:10139 stop:10396 length:258 start_codon:yes stop_codon:yes gene_type:complete